MQFTILTLTLLTLPTSLLAQGGNVTYRAFSNTVSCLNKDAFTCTDNGNRCCGDFPEGWGYSAQFDTLPSGATGLGFNSSGCSTDFVFKLYGSAGESRCWNGGGNARVTFMKWTHPVKTRRNDVKGEECAHPDGFTYHDDKGIERAIKIAQGNASVVHEIARLHRNGDFKALAAYHALPILSGPAVWLATGRLYDLAPRNLLPILFQPRTVHKWLPLTLVEVLVCLFVVCAAISCS